MEEQRIRHLVKGYCHFSDIEKNVLPIISKCLEGIAAAGNKINEKQVVFLNVLYALTPLVIRLSLLFKSNLTCTSVLNAAMHLSLQDSILFIEQHKSGFERPAEVEFEDYTQGIKAATSDSSLNPPKVRTKLWPFSKKHKVNIHAFLKLNRIFNLGGI